MALASEDKRSRLMRLVSQYLEELYSDAFNLRWTFYKTAIDIQDVQAYYVKVKRDINYINVAVLGDGLIVDMDGDNSNEDCTFSIHPLSMIRSVYLTDDGMEGIELTEDASLMVNCRLAGGGGFYWFAEDRAEEVELLGFVKVLARSIGQD